MTCRRAARSMAACLLLLAGDAAAQTKHLDAELLRELPNGFSLFAFLETTQPDIVSDRFNGGGLNVAEPARLGSFLNSWSQTRYRLGEVDISSAVDGTPLVYPHLILSQSLRTASVMTSGDHAAPGLAVTLDPLMAAGAWSSHVEVFATPRALVAAAPEGPPPTAQLARWRQLSGAASGPISDRLAIGVAGVWSANEVRDRGTANVRRGQLAMLSGAAAFAIDQKTQFQLSAIVQSTTNGDVVHAQTAWLRTRSNRSELRAFGGFTRAARGAAGVEQQWSGGARLSRMRYGARHELSAGATFEHAAIRTSAADGVRVEHVDDVAARVWVYALPAQDSRRRAQSVSVFAEDRITMSERVTMDVAARYDLSRGSASGASQGIFWNNVLPRATLSWQLGTPLELTFVTGVRRAANRLLLELLTIGDPGSPVADVYRYDATQMDGRGPLVAKSGPGIRGDASFSVIAPDLRRSHTDEFLIGAESRFAPSWRVSLTGIARRQSRLVQLVNTGVPQPSYRLFTVRDDNADLVKPDDDQDLPVYDRTPATFAQDRYLLTNPENEGAKMGAFIIAAEKVSPRVFWSIGATAAASVGAGGNRGFGPAENDPDVLGDRLINPNAATYARGRLFSDRAYTIKSALVLRFPRQMRLGVIARYQDGQPFTRLVAVPGLNQGTEVIQAFPRGRSRFAFTGTLDIRVQKGVRLGATRLDAILDVYNLPDMQKETEEYVFTGPRFRQTTAIQPPRSGHLGVRVSF